MVIITDLLLKNCLLLKFFHGVFDLQNRQKFILYDVKFQQFIFIAQARVQK